jgi:hypothetical protein
MPTQKAPVISETDNEVCCGTCRKRWNKKSIAVTVILGLLTILPIAVLIMGQLYKNDCPIQTWIPQWMTILGAVSLATFCALFFIVRNSFCFNVQ